MIPIEHSGKGKHVVLHAWIRSIPNKAIDPGFVEGKPGGVEISYDSSSIDEVAIVKMMVIAILKSASHVQEAFLNLGRCTRFTETGLRSSRLSPNRQ